MDMDNRVLRAELAVRRAVTDLQRTVGIHTDRLAVLEEARAQMGARVSRLNRAMAVVLMITVALVAVAVVRG